MGKNKNPLFPVFSFIYFLKKKHLKIQPSPSIVSRLFLFQFGHVVTWLRSVGLLADHVFNFLSLQIKILSLSVPKKFLPAVDSFILYIERYGNL